MVGDSWTHKIARFCIVPLLNTPVTPNHLTGVRLVTGIAACTALAVGTRECDILGGWLWVLSAFLDRADGELARVSGKTSAIGHKFDLFSDITVTALFFLGAGIGLRGEILFGADLGQWPIWLGALAAAGVVMSEVFAEYIDRAKADTGDKAYPGIFGFDFDDILYLFAPVVWIDFHIYFVLGASVGAPAFALLTWSKWRALSWK